MERETELEERQRHDREVAEDNRARQERQGVVVPDSGTEPGVEEGQENEAEEAARQEEERQLTEQQSQQYQGGEIPQSETSE